MEELWPGYCWVEVADGLPGLQSCKIHDGNNLRYLHLQENIEAVGWFTAKWQYEAEFNIPDTGMGSHDTSQIHHSALHKELCGKVREGKYLSGITILTFHPSLYLKVSSAWLLVSSIFCSFILSVLLALFSFFKKK